MVVALDVAAGLVESKLEERTAGALQKSKDIAAYRHSHRRMAGQDFVTNSTILHPGEQVLDF